MYFCDVDEEIKLSMLIDNDAERLFEITDQSREYLREWLPWVDQTKTIKDSQAFIQLNSQMYLDRIGLTAGIFYKNELVGVAGFNRIDWENKIGYIGYWLASDYQDRGIMTRVVHALIDYAFHHYDLNRIDIRTATGNKKSQAIPERLGFTNEGTLRQAEWLYDHFVDHFVYGLLKNEWNPSSKKQIFPGK